jgi:hypothetical protein
VAWWAISMSEGTIFSGMGVKGVMDLG